MHVIVDEPKISEDSLINLIFSIAAEFMHTLSAPDLRKFSISFIDLIPPPTDSGINKFFEVFNTNFFRLLVPYKDATLST